MNEVTSSAQKYEARGTRFSMPAPGARMALDMMTRHAQAVKSGEGDFIPDAPDGEFLLNVVLSVSPFAKEQPGMWECGGSMGTYGGVNLISGPTGNPLNPLAQFRYNPEHSCDRHVLLPVKEGYLLTHAAHGNGSALITCWRCQQITFEKLEDDERGGVYRAVFKLIYATDSINEVPLFLAEEDEAIVDNPMFLAMIQAAWSKANMFQCKVQAWAYPWMPWIVKRGGREWELPEPVANNTAILEALHGVGMSDPDPKTVVTDYDAMVADMEKMSSSTIFKFLGSSTAKRGPRVHILQYFTQEANGSVRITSFLLLHNVKTPKIVKTWVYIADPNTTPQSERPEPAYFLNNRRGVHWNVIKEKFGNEAANGIASLVYEYTGC